MKKVITIAFLLILLVAFVGISGSRLLRPSPTMYLTPTPPVHPGDIDRSGTVDSVDGEYVRSNLGCRSSNPCWQKVIGKTKDGDNPIYTSDVDLNKNGIIDQADLDMVK